MSSLSSLCTLLYLYVLGSLLAGGLLLSLLAQPYLLLLLPLGIGARLWHSGRGIAGRCYGDIWEVQLGMLERSYKDYYALVWGGWHELEERMLSFSLLRILFLGC